MRVLEAYEQRGLRFSNGYGMTETAPGATTLPAARSRDKAGSSGLPHFFTDVRVADLDRRRAAPRRERWGDPDQGPQRHPPSTGTGPRPRRIPTPTDGWFKSGDMGYKDPDGFVFISDRLKDMIISGGENIYPAEVEQAIAELDAVGSVAVIGVPDEKWGEVPRAVVLLREGARLTEEQLRAHLEGRLARYKIPKSVVFVDEMPRTASGKIRKADLRKLAPGHV